MAQSSNKILTIPNLLTIIRLALLPAFVVVAFNNLIAGVLFILLLAITDLLDGYIARKYHQQSEFGRILDPISDRALTLVSFITFLILGALPWLFVLLVGLREILVIIGTAFIYRKKQIRLDVNFVGKASAFATMITTPAWVVLSQSTGTFHDILFVCSLAGSVIAIGCGYWSLISYINAYRQQ